MLKTLKSKHAAATQSSISDLLDDVDECRDQIGALRKERAAVENAPRPLAETIDMLDQHLDRIATNAVDALSLHHLRDRNTAFALRLSQSGQPGVEVTNLLGLLVAVAREPLREIVAAQLGDLDLACPGLSDQDRAQKLAALDAAILRAELAEEHALRALERHGVAVARRADAHPLAVLAADAALAGE